MNYLISAKTDVGLTKSTNQDSVTVQVFNTQQGRMAFAVMCDGMGGFEKGEVASASVIKAFDSWAKSELPKLCNYEIEDPTIRNQWEHIINEQNVAIMNYGHKRGFRLGTTATVMLITQFRYYILNVGDSRVYEISDDLVQLTNDQTFVAREVALGNLTPQQAENDPRRSVLLQCVGASDVVYPEMFFGVPKNNAVYMLCTDGFRHEITKDEMFSMLCPDALPSEEIMNFNSEKLIDLNKQREERDNITVALIRTY